MRKKALADWIKQNFWLFGLLLALFALSACEIPNAMSVRAGLDPKYVDDHVRFRARYYYTVIEHCSEDGLTLAKSPNITLYRYTLTGKAPSLSAKVKFEAGLMPTEIVEKFGSKLPDNGKLKKPDANNSDVPPAGDVPPDPSAGGDTPDPPAGGDTPDPSVGGDLSAITPPINSARVENVQEVIMTQMDAEQTDVQQEDDAGEDVAPSGGVSSAGKSEEKDKYCYDEVFISGPEGTIPDDDTKSLVLSMTTSASPLIQSLGALNNLATVLRNDEAGMMDSAMLSSDFKSEEIIAQQIQLILLEEKDRMTQEGASLPTPDQVKGMMRLICATLEEGAGQCPVP